MADNEILSSELKRAAEEARWKTTTDLRIKTLEERSIHMAEKLTDHMKHCREDHRMMIDRCSSLEKRVAVIVTLGVVGFAFVGWVIPLLWK